jgi:hypothetical protein
MRSHRLIKIFVLFVVIASIVLAMTSLFLSNFIYADTTEVYNGSASDGYINPAYNATYSVVWGGTTGTVTNTDLYLYLGQLRTGPGTRYFVYRGYLYFNTSLIPDTAIISSANVSLRGINDYSTKDFDITIQSGMPTYPHDPLVTGDFDKTNYSGNGGSLNSSAYSTNYMNISMSAAGIAMINLTGWTKLCLRSSLDIAGTAPTGSEYLIFYSYEQGAAYYPHLQVTYTLPAGGSDVYLTTSVSGSGTVNPSAGTYNYSQNTVVNISATASACNHFVNWTGNTSDIGDVNAASTNISMGTVNKTATANFAINTSTITYTNGSNGTINNSTPQTINCGTNTTWVLATPNACYKFVNWNDSSTMNPRSDVGTSTNQSFLANFAINTSVITYNAGAGGTIVGSTPQTINCSSYTTAVTATPNACYRFVNWNDANTSATRTDLGTSTDQTFTANFAINTSVITYSAGANGTLNNSTPQTVNCGAYSSSVLATGNACYRFLNWDDASTTNPRNDLGTSTNQSYTANFVINTSTITYSAGAGGTLNNSTPQTINCGDYTASVLATANACYRFINWSDASTTNPRNDVGTSTNQTFTANFAINTSVITYSAGANGTINGTSPQTLNCGTSTTSVTAEANACYHFTSWNDANTSASRTDIGTSTNQTFTASFAINVQTVTYVAGAGGTVNGSWPQNVNCGSNGNWVLASPNACYHFVDWSDTSTTNPRQETNVTSNVSLTANFDIDVFTVEYVAGANGAVNGSWPENVNCGDDSSWVEATADPCYHFVDWSDSSTDNPRQETNVTANGSFTANFAIDVQTVEYIAGANGSVNGSWPENVNCGDNSSWVEATPDPCYRFVNWSDSSITNPRQELNVTSNLSYTANFAINVFTLTYGHDANGVIVGTTPQTINCGSNGSQVTANPIGCYHFVNWSDASVVNPRTDLNISANLSVTANFDINTYTLTYNAGAGGSIVGTTPQTINCGANGVQVTATPNACYHFTSWSDGIITASRTELNVVANKTVTASFAINVYVLTYGAGTNGTINGSSPQNINCGSNGTAINAVPNSCYHFVNWSDANTSNPRTDLNVSANLTVVANFAINTSTLTYTAVAGGSINGTSPQTINCGANGTAVTALPNACFSFVNWSDSAVSNPRTDTNVSTNISVTANFVAATYTLTYTAGAGGSINGITPQTVNCLDNGSTVTAVPNACYTFTGWSDALATAGRTDLNISANLSVTASFAMITYTLNVSSGANGNVTTPTEGTHTYNCGQVVNLVATPNWAYNFSTWTGNTTTILDVNDETTTITMNGNYSISCSFVASTALFPPTNLIPTLSENTSGNTSFWCLNLSWIKGVNSPETIIVICRDTVLPCANKSTIVPSDCMVLYNGNGSSFDMDSCGWQIDYYDYTITAWGSDGSGNYSALCTNLSLGGTKMTSLFGIAIGIAIALIMLVLALWKKQWWIFMTDGLIWFILMAFAFTQYTTADMMYWFGYVYLVLAIICIGCVFWFREKHETINPDVEESIEDKREKRSKKLSGLRNLGHKVSGKDY